MRLQNVQHPGHNRLVHGEVEPLTLGVDSQRAVGGLPLGELACKDQLHEACARVARPNELEEDAGDQQLRAWACVRTSQSVEIVRLVARWPAQLILVVHKRMGARLHTERRGELRSVQHR